MPNQPKTPVRTIRVPDDLWAATAVTARRKGVTTSDVIRKILTDYIADTLPPPHACQHTAYRMTCADYDALSARANGKCELCGERREPIWIDHDHLLGFSAVRGLVCPKCNAHLRRVDAGERVRDVKVVAYLANAWHLSAVR